MSTNLTQGGLQSSSYAERTEHATISGVEGKKVFVVGSDGNQISDFGAKYNTSDIDEASATVTYIGKMDADGGWMIQKIDTSSGTAFTYATVLNNPTLTTYALGWAGRATNTYGTYSEAL